MTEREIACLQTVPLQHKLGDKGTLKQVGNMVPPRVAEVFMRHIKEFLEKEDGLFDKKGMRRG